jgi:hypothetical protein
MPPISSIILPRDVAHTFLYHYEAKAPSALDVCDGELKIWAALQLEYRAIFDPTLTVRITRVVCPQFFKWFWMVDTDGNVEIEGSKSDSACGKADWQPHPANPKHALGSSPGLDYNTRTFRLDTDPPFGAQGSADDEDYVIAMRPHGEGAKFRWDASILSVGTPLTPITPGGTGGFFPPLTLPPFLFGLGFQDLPFDVEWAIWLEAEDGEIDELLPEHGSPDALAVAGYNVRVLVKGFVDPAAIPNMSVAIRKTDVAKTVFESPTGFTATQRVE